MLNDLQLLELFSPSELLISCEPETVTVSPATATFNPSGEKLVTSRLICQLSPVQLTFSEVAKAEEEEEEKESFIILGQFFCWP